MDSPPAVFAQRIGHINNVRPLAAAKDATASSPADFLNGTSIYKALIGFLKHAEVTHISAAHTGHKDAPGTKTDKTHSKTSNSKPQRPTSKKETIRGSNPDLNRGPLAI
jgi:hypothetical protein